MANISIPSFNEFFASNIVEWDRMFPKPDANNTGFFVYVGGEVFTVIDENKAKEMSPLYEPINVSENSVADHMAKRADFIATLREKYIAALNEQHGNLSFLTHEQKSLLFNTSKKILEEIISPYVDEGRLIAALANFAYELIEEESLF